MSEEKLLKDIDQLLLDQKEFFASGATMDTAFRLKALKKLKKAVIDNADRIAEALSADLQKPLFESYTAETGYIVKEINFALKNLPRWAKRKKTRSIFFTLPSRNYIVNEPYGLAMIMGPWNYPFQLTFAPLVGAIAAGNCCLVKPSEIAEQSSALIASIINDTFEHNYIAAVEGDVKIARALLERKFDKIFFTGSPAVGKIVMEKAAQNLTEVTLELGGKSPCVVDSNVDPFLSAKRIIFGKFFNAGQTCITPDYVLVHKDIKEKLFHAMHNWLGHFYGTDPKTSPDYGRIINRKHFRRLKNYLADGAIIAGGEYDEAELYLAPTILEVNDLDKPVMQEEIFGPILPVIEYNGLDQVEEIIARNPNPLACYIFSNNRSNVERLTTRIPFGSGCINDTIIYTYNHHLPFGGRGGSGIGKYHGKYSFDAFSHQKAIMVRKFRLDPAIIYPPYKKALHFFKKLLLR